MKEKQNMSNYTYNTGGFKGKLAGKTYDSLEAMRHCERLEAMRRACPQRTRPHSTISQPTR
jgi:hypothetical protein